MTRSILLRTFTCLLTFAGGTVALAPAVGWTIAAALSATVAYATVALAAAGSAAVSRANGAKPSRGRRDGDLHER